MNKTPSSIPTAHYKVLETRHSASSMVRFRKHEMTHFLNQLPTIQVDVAKIN